MLLKYAKEKKFTHDELEKSVDKSMLSCRVFTVQSIDKMECLVLTFSNLDNIKIDFITQMRKFIKDNIKQTQNVIKKLIAVL